VNIAAWINCIVQFLIVIVGSLRNVKERYGEPERGE
jgi:hypothetical protein